MITPRTPIHALRVGTALLLPLLFPVSGVALQTSPAAPVAGEHVEAEGLADRARSAEREYRPLLLVPGWGDRAADIAPLRDRLVEAGWPDMRVAAVGFDNPFGSNRENAREIALAVEVLRGLTGSDQVDIVAHSMGGLAVREYLLHLGGGEWVEHVVFLGTPHRGTVAAILAWGDGGREMVPGSEFLDRLNEGTGIPDGVEVLSVRTPVDLRVIPASSAMLPGFENVEICCPTHTGLVKDERAFEEILRFLRGESAGPSPLVLPSSQGVGAWFERMRNGG